jgi:hypothetical protein
MTEKRPEAERSRATSESDRARSRIKYVRGEPGGGIIIVGSNNVIGRWAASLKKGRPKKEPTS